MNEAREIAGKIYRKVKIDRISKSGNAIAELGRGHIHVNKDPEIDIEPKANKTYIVKMRSKHSLKSVITGFRTFDGIERFDTWEEEREWIACPKPSEFFTGTIDRICPSGNRAIDIDNEFADALLVDEGNVGDKVEVRVTKRSSEELIGRVIEYPDKEADAEDLSEDKKDELENKFKSKHYDSNRNDLLDGKM